MRGGVRVCGACVHAAWWVLIVVSLLYGGLAGARVARLAGVGAPWGWVLVVLIGVYVSALVVEARAARCREKGARSGEVPAQVGVLMVGAACCLAAAIAVPGLSMTWTFLLLTVPLTSAVAVEAWMSSWWSSRRRSA